MKSFGAIAAAAAALALPSAAATAPETARTVTVSASDYPDDVRPGAAEYRVRLRFEFGVDGMLARCSIASSSGNPSIDSASCHILERALIRPGRGLTGLLEFGWLGENSLANGNARGAPIPIGFIDTIRSTDYPQEAIRRRESGTLDYAVEVSAAGLPLGCTVTRSSGSAALDRRTCELAMTRAAFFPAVDGSSRRIAGTWRGRFRWRLP